MLSAEEELDASPFSPSLDKREGMMMIHLFQNDQFYQIWNRGEVIFTHNGTIGCKGEVTEIHLVPPQSLDAAIQEQIRGAEQEGFLPVRNGQLSQLLVTYNIPPNWEQEDTQIFQEELFELMSDVLGWSGNGFCDGYTLGREGLSIGAPQGLWARS